MIARLMAQVEEPGQRGGGALDAGVAVVCALPSSADEPNLQPRSNRVLLRVLPRST